MYKLNHFSGKNVVIAATYVGTLLIGLLMMTESAAAQQQTSKLNPCPSIYYEEPHRNRVSVPAGCPPNAATLRLQQKGQTLGRPTVLVVPTRTGVTPIQPPAPESRQGAIATVTPTAGTVDVKLKNNTNAGISYQAVGHTQPRFLVGRQEFVLRDLPTPVTITLVREDGGLLKVMLMSTSEGTLSVSLDETTNFDNNQGVLRIQRDGQVFLN
jgi:hypothetical protein